MTGSASALKETPLNPKFLVIHDTDALQAQQLQIIDGSHKRRGYHESAITNPATGSGYFIAYHYFVGKDGTIVKTRPDTDRTQHTSCGLGLKKCVSVEAVNEQSIAVVLAGAFEQEQPSKAQLAALRKLVKELDAKYQFERIMPHRGASPTSCPGDNLVNVIQDLFREPAKKDDVWQVTRYYTPEKGQARYYRTVPDDMLVELAVKHGLVEHGQLGYWHGTVRLGNTPAEALATILSNEWRTDLFRTEIAYHLDFRVNCSGDCLVTADGYRLKPEDAFKVAACPKEYAFGTRFEIDGIGTVTCRDRGGAIKITKTKTGEIVERRLDVWAGVGDHGLQNILTTKGGPLKVRVLP